MLYLRFFLLFFLSAILPAAAGHAAERPLLWAADAEGGAPYVYQDPAHPEKVVGFEVDIVEAISRRLGREIRFHQYDYKSLMLGLERGDFDFAMNGLEVTEDRKQHVSFSRPYFVYGEQLVVRKDETRFDSLEACRRLSCVVGTLEETAAERILDSLGVPKKIYDGQVEPYQDLALGRTDAVLLDTPIVQYYAAPNPALRMTGPVIGQGTYAIAFRTDDKKLAASFDAALAGMIADGELQQILQRWQLWNADQALLEGKNPGELMAAASRGWSFTKYLPLLLQGAAVTVAVSIVGMALAIFIGLPLALMRLYGPKPVAWLAVGYIEFFRGIPTLLLLYFLYYGLPSVAIYYGWGFSLALSPLQAAVLGFGMNYAAYEAEIYRAGIGSVAKGQWEAATSLGMSKALTFRRIIFPQALRNILPPMTNDFVALFKDTSLVSVIAVVELTKQYQILSKSSAKYAEIGLVTAALYLMMSVPLSRLSHRMEKRLKAGG